MSAYSPDRKTEHLLKLSDEVSRIAGTLARLSVEPSASERTALRADAPELSAERIKAILRARRLRSRFFNSDLFADPAWDMMLDLLYGELAHRHVTVSHLCAASAVPPTTALRWLNTLVKRGLAVRRDDPRDGRRVFVELAPHASATLRAYFAEIDVFPT